MSIDWSELIACRGHASAKGVPKAIAVLFSSVSPQERKEAYWQIDNFVVVQNDLYESAVYAARMIVDKIKSNPQKLNLEILGILDELAKGQAGDSVVEHGPLKGQPIQKLCREIVAEILPTLAATRSCLSGS